MKKILLPLYLMSLSFPLVSFAQGGTTAPQSGSTGGTTGSTKLSNPLKADSFEGLFQNILTEVIIPVSATIGVFFIIWAGFGFVTAQGNDTKLSAAKKRLMYVLIGVGIVIASEIILDLLLNTLREVSNVNA